MKVSKELEENPKQIMAACPLCGATVPVFSVEITYYGLFKRRTMVTIEGDATDWVSHLWTHQDRAYDIR